MAPTHPQRPGARYPIATNVRLAQRFLTVAMLERDLRIVERRALGFTLAELADQEHISIARVRQILNVAARQTAAEAAYKAQSSG